MTEKEKAAKGLLYDANFDKQILEDRFACKCACYEYNQLHPKQIEDKNRLIRKLFARTGENFVIEPPFFCDYGYNIEIGENFYSNHNLIILDGAKVTFGKNVFIAPNCGFYTAGHPLDTNERIQGLEYAYPIIIGDNVWIGAHTAVMPGVTIGNNSVIGSGSIVTKDIPAGVLAFGNPCRVIRTITEEDRLKYHRS